MGLTVDGLRLHLERWHHDALAEAERNEPDGPEPAPAPGNVFKHAMGVGGVGLLEVQLDPIIYRKLMARLDARFEKLVASGALENDPRSVQEIYGDLFAGACQDFCVSRSLLLG